MVKGGDGGAEEDRTPDLCIANAALSQLSYGPVFFKTLSYNALQQSEISPLVNICPLAH